jgi:hypothetical protein
VGLCSPLLAESAREVERAGALEVAHQVDAVAAILAGVLLALVHVLLTRGTWPLHQLTSRNQVA